MVHPQSNCKTVEDSTPRCHSSFVPLPPCNLPLVCDGLLGGGGGGSHQVTVPPPPRRILEWPKKTFLRRLWHLLFPMLFGPSDGLGGGGGLQGGRLQRGGGGCKKEGGRCASPDMSVALPMNMLETPVTTTKSRNIYCSTTFCVPPSEPPSKAPPIPHHHFQLSWFAFVVFCT